MHKICIKICKNKDSFSKNMQKYAKNMQKYAIKYAEICRNMQVKNAEICKIYAKTEESMFLHIICNSILYYTAYYIVQYGLM